MEKKTNNFKPQPKRIELPKDLGVISEIEPSLEESTRMDGSGFLKDKRKKFNPKNIEKYIEYCEKSVLTQDKNQKKNTKCKKKIEMGYLFQIVQIDENGKFKAIEELKEIKEKFCDSSFYKVNKDE